MKNFKTLLVEYKQNTQDLEYSLFDVTPQMVEPKRISNIDKAVALKAIGTLQEILNDLHKKLK